MGDRVVLSRSDLECAAAEVLRRHSSQSLEEPSMTPLAEIAKKECVRLGAVLNVNQDLGTTVRGERIRGSCRIKKPYAIAISADLDMNGPRFRFTLAHELGHLELHRDIDLDALGRASRDSEIDDDDRHLFQGSRYAPKTERGWMEWQANTFASAVLMPRITVPVALRRYQEALGVRRPGAIYVDHQPINLSTYNALVGAFSRQYQVSRTAVIYRLKALNLVTDMRAKLQAEGDPQSSGGFKQVLEHLRSVQG